MATGWYCACKWCSAGYSCRELSEDGKNRINESRRRFGLRPVEERP